MQAASPFSAVLPSLKAPLCFAVFHPSWLVARGRGSWLPLCCLDCLTLTAEEAGARGSRAGPAAWTGRGRWRCTDDSALRLCAWPRPVSWMGRTPTGLGDVAPFTRLMAYWARLPMCWFYQSPFLPLPPSWQDPWGHFPKLFGQGAFYFIYLGLCWAFAAGRTFL